MSANDDHPNRRKEITVIAPTVGRIVWFHKGTGQDALIEIDSRQPMAAIITYVHHDRLINVTVFNHEGVCYPLTSVQLLQDGEIGALDAFYCEWMPFQKGQAMRTQELEQRAQAIHDKLDGPAAPSEAQQS